MSRETDTPSSGPNGRGGAAYPSGTPPYGTPAASDGTTDAGRSAAQPEERKTETTLTTRIRINIPGSRPIPPVVMRKPVGETDGSDAAEGPEGTGRAEAAPSGDTGARPAGAPAPAAETPAEPAPRAGEKPTSDWFAPRKSSPGKGGQPGPGAKGATPPGGSPAGPPPGGAGAPAGRNPGAGRPGGVVGAMKAPGGSQPGTSPGARPGGASGTGLPGATGGPVAPGHGGGTGSFDVTEALAAGPLGGAARPGSGPGGEPGGEDLPYFADNGAADQQGGGLGAPDGGYGGPGDPYGGPRGLDDPYGTARGQNPPGGYDAPRGPGGPGVSAGHGSDPFGVPGGPGAGPGPSGPTSGPVTGDGPTVTPAGGTGAPGPHGTAVPGAGAGAGLGTGQLSDDTAILTPQTPAPEPPPGGYGAPGDQVSGPALNGGLPVVPPAGGTGAAGGSPFGPVGGIPFDDPEPNPPQQRSEPERQRSTPAPAPKKKGRSKAALLVGGLVVLAAGAYGAGLLMNHSDVPRGTTVLGVDIGGGTRDQAAKVLDQNFGKRVGQPLKLSVGGKTVTLKPDQAGLQFDEDATVGAAAQSDYNPVSVIGSLFGRQRVVEPVMPVDEEKLQAALRATAAGGTGSATEGTIRFESGKAVAVHGKPGKGVDVIRARQIVEQAYRTQVETGSAGTVRLPTATTEPTVSDAEVDREMKEFAEPAMSANVSVRTDATHFIEFSPEKSLWKFLRVKAVNGKLVDSPDLDALAGLYGKTFDGVLIARANGEKTAVTPQDVYGALRQALLSTTHRDVVIDTDPS
ncbi:hypothetical protein ACL02U_21760 [Streptomyces sp. MS06]|uniref:hypothetical protein n=1 Tax=Streptomyces sp. MS06 TaxID=3385974 RepID=UPI0039A15616